MDAYAQQNSAGFAFQTPFQPQGAGPLRPFSAVDIAPPAKPGAPGPLVPTVSPFLDSFDAPEPAEAHVSAIMPAPAPVAPPPPPAAARQSRIMAASDLAGSSGSAIKPRFFLTSTAVVDGYPIQSYLDVISVEIVLPKDLLFRNPAPYGELHRLKAAEDTLQKVKAKALQADAIVGVTVTFTNLDTVCCLCSAVGTAIKIA